MLMYKRGSLTMITTSKLDKYIEKLLQMGIFKINDHQLYECSEKEVKQALFHALSRNRKVQVH
ncbi:Fur-regulated basic protein FbpA [Aneurinibacillus soli]